MFPKGTMAEWFQAKEVFQSPLWKRNLVSFVVSFDL